MKAATSTTRTLGAGLIVYLTPEDRRRLREVLKGEGTYSASAWLRQVVIQKIREAEARQQERANAGR
jgi:hypothetical protein